MAPAEPLTISRDVARRYLLGRQGLWPGRRWKGKAGAAKAIHALESVQMDPLVIVARSHDLVLWSRVLDYRPEQLESLMYEERRFFDYGGHLDIYPMSELPYWRLHMRRRRDDHRWQPWALAHRAAVEAVRRRVTAEGPLGPRDFEAGVRLQSYRGSKEAGIALYYLWLIGELMTHSRRRSERVYDLTERIAPPAYQPEASEAEVAHHFATKWVRSAGLASTATATSLVGYAFGIGLGAESSKQRLARLLDDARAVPIRVEGVRDQYYAPTEDVPLLTSLSAGRVPLAWKTSHATTLDEVIFLSPLDNLLDRRRTLALFDFEYVWEIYKKPAQRRWGRYTLPVLYGDKLVARLDPKLHRTTGTLAIEGFWLEDQATARNRAFGAALTHGLARLAAFLGATQIEYAPLSTPTAAAAALMSRSVRSFKGMPSAR